MPVPLIVWGIGLIIAAGWSAKQVEGALDEAGQAADSSVQLAKWAVVGGSLYVSYRAMQSAGAIK